MLVELVKYRNTSALRRARRESSIRNSGQWLPGVLGRMLVKRYKISRKKEEEARDLSTEGDYWSSLCRASEVSTEQKLDSAHPHRAGGKTGS